MGEHSVSSGSRPSRRALRRIERQQRSQRAVSAQARREQPQPRTASALIADLEELMRHPIEWRDIHAEPTPPPGPVQPPRVRVKRSRRGAVRGTIQGLLDSAVEALLGRDYPRARACFTQVVALEPSHRQARTNLRRLAMLGY